MELQNLPSVTPTDAEYDECYCAFSKAVTERNEELINVLISKKGILHRHFSEKEDTLLHIVAQRGTVATAAEMCKLGVNVNLQNKYGETPIFHAIKHSTEMVNLLIKNGAFLSMKCNQYARPLQEALLSGTEETVQIIMNKMFADKRETHLRSIKVQNSEETIKALLHHTDDLFLDGDDYPLLIFFAAKIGNLDLFKKTLAGCKKYLDTESEYLLEPPLKELDFDGFVERTALHYAVWQQNPEVVRFLLKEGADVNCTTLSYYTPLHLAAYFENEEICRILLSFGAQMNLRDGKEIEDDLSGVSPLYLVCGGNESLRLNDADDSDFFYEKRDGFVKSRISSQPQFEVKPIFNLGIMKLLLDHGANPDFGKDDEGMTPLLEACKAGHLEPVKLLLEFGANICTCDCYGNTALHYATCGDNFEIVDLLLKRGFDIESKNEDGDTPLLFCLYNREETCVEMIEYLADVGANINARNSTGFSCLRIASHYDFPDNIECILELGANFEMEFISADHILGLDPSRKTLIASFTLKENLLVDYIKNYIPNERNEINQILQFCETCKLEIEKLKCADILENGRLSFYDFLSRDIYSALQMIKNKRIRKVFISEEYKNQFPCYSYLLKKRFERLELLENTIDDVVGFLRGYKDFNLPILIVETILSFFCSSDFRNFGKALLSKRT